MLSSSKEENLLVLLKYQDPFIQYVISWLSSLGSEFQHYSEDFQFAYQPLFKQTPENYNSVAIV